MNVESHSVLCRLLEPKATSLQHRLRCDDPQFLDFMTRLLAIDPAERYDIPWNHCVRETLTTLELSDPQHPKLFFIPGLRKVK